MKKIIDVLVYAFVGVTILTLALCVTAASPMFLLTYAIAYLVGDKSVR